MGGTREQTSSSGGHEAERTRMERRSLFAGLKIALFYTEWFTAEPVGLNKPGRVSLRDTAPGLLT